MPESVAAAAERGVDISGHVARPLVAEHARQADLVLGMAAEHRDAVATAVPEAASRTFTLKELVRLLEALPVSEGEESPGARLTERVTEADALRSTGFRGNPHDEDVVDPLGLPLEGYRAIAWELDEWCTRLADGLFGKARERTGAPGTEGE
jgi:protein-tyrosine phosphatase